MRLTLYLYDDKTPRNQWAAITVLAVGLMTIVYGIAEKTRGTTIIVVDSRNPAGREKKQPFPAWGRLLLVLIPIVWMAALVWRLNIRLSLPQSGLTPLNTPTLTPVSPLTATPHAGATYISPIDNALMLFIPAGPFQMGSENGYSDTQPVHTNTLNDYWIDRSEVTNARYALCVMARACQPPTDTSSHTRSSYYGESQFANYPVIYVDWDQAKTYCEWAGKRLPTEAEWEKAARGSWAKSGESRIYPWGNALPNSNLLNFNGDIGDTTEVGRYPNGVSPYGALDMAGNVWEWVNDWYDGNYYSDAPLENPTGPSTGSYRVLRGGSWSTIEVYVRATARFGLVPSGSTYDDVGFRCARSP